jgi:ferredoxin-NADP reductase
LTQSATSFPKLLFMCFIHLTDIEKDVTPDEVQDFQTLVGNPKWTKNRALRMALEQLRSQYEALWSAYATHALTIGIDPIREHWHATCQGLAADEVSSIHMAVLEFVRKVHQSSPQTRAKGGATGINDGRRQARAELEALFATPPAAGDVRPTAAPTPAAADEARAVTGTISPTSLIAAPKDPGIRPGGATKVRCVKITPEAHNVKTYTFVPEPPAHFDYKPGQFITIELPIDGRVLRRSYTLSSSPTRPHSLAITVKRVPKGWVSNWLYDNMEVGFECTLSGPHGDFTCVDHPSNNLLMISGGSGVTPMMSMLRFLADLSAPADIVFINNVLTPSDIIFEKELMYLSSRFGEALKLGIVPTKLPVGQAWPSLVGPWNDGTLLAFAPDFMERETFVCGPPGYVDLVRGTLARLGYPMHRFHQERFGSAPATPATPILRPARQESEPQVAVEQSPIPQPATPQPAIEQTEIVFQKSGVTLACADGDVILDVAEQNGLALASACRSGVCGACKVRKIDGVVGMGDQTALNEWDVEEGSILVCIGTAHGRVVIDA